MGKYTPMQIFHHAMSTHLFNGAAKKWAPARPLTLWHFGRIRMAWHVITMRADALYWEEDQ